MMHAFSGILVRFHPRDIKSSCECGLSKEATQSAPNNEDSSAARDGAKESSAPSTKPADFEGDLHVNIWEIGKECFMDIGVMIEDRDSISAVQIDVPWELKLRDVTDLGARLNGEKSVAAIFNEVVHYDGYADGNFATIKFRRDKTDFGDFTLLRLNSEFYTLRPLYLSGDTQASQLIVKLPARAANQPSKRVYIRLRLRRVPKEVYTSIFYQKDRSLLSSSTETRIVDFRINVRRGVPDELLTTNDGTEFPRFGKIHCFLTTERSDDCVFQSTNFKGARSLVDEDVWNEYIKRDARDGISKATSVRNYLGYQWTEAAKPAPKGEIARGVKDLVVLGRFSKTTSGISYILRFVALGLIFGTSGSALWELLTPTEGQNIFSKIAVLFGEGEESVNARKILCAIGILITLAFALFLVTWPNIKKTAKCAREKMGRSSEQP